jgi:hypothetical protein
MNTIAIRSNYEEIEFVGAIENSGDARDETMGFMA